MRRRFAKFMYGRYGADNLSRFINVLSLIILLASMFFRGIAQSVLFAIALAVIIYSYVRFFSKNISARRAENTKYLQRKNKITSWFNLRRDMWKQRKEYKFFKCPSCKAVLRVPRNKGSIRIVCKKCGTGFEKKT